MSTAASAASMGRTVVHASFTLERVYSATPQRVFRAWSNREAKARWFSGQEGYTLEFRVGGRESNRAGPPGGPVYKYDAVYHDIVPDERIVYSYELWRGDTLLSVSIATVELAPAAGGTRLVLTEQGSFLDGHDTSSQREHGTRILLERIVDELLRSGSAS